MASAFMATARKGLLVLCLMKQGRGFVFVTPEAAMIVELRDIEMDLDLPLFAETEHMHVAGRQAVE
ncbi:MAG: hypothetical protein ACYTG7_19100 [Planctomycetota bacterium]|jgi:hypothetical protein